MSTDAHVATCVATIRLGALLSMFATVCTVGLSVAGDVSAWSLAVSFALIGFVASWVQSGHTMSDPSLLVDAAI